MRIVLFFFLVFQIGFISAQETRSGLKFIPNKKQWHENVLYRADLPGGKLYAEQKRFTYIFYDTEVVASFHNHHKDATATKPHDTHSDIPTIGIHAFRVNPIGALSTAQIIPSAPSSEVYNFFIGNDSTKWASGLRASSALRYNGIYENIDMRLYEQNRSFKYEFIVGVGADPNKIKLQYEGLKNIRLQNGNLILETSVNTITENAPYVYQTINGREVKIESKFVLNDSIVSFQLLQDYNKDYTLIIDPQLIFSTYSGATTDNWGNTAAFDEDENMYSGGTVFGIGYPVTVGAYQIGFAGFPLGPPPFYNNYGFGIDVGILKFNPTGTALLYATYLGGLYTEAPYSLVVNSADELVMMGTTSSLNFPTTVGAFDNSFNGGVGVMPVNGIIFANGCDIFVSRLSSDGTALLASTYVGGSANDGVQLDGELLTKNYGDQLRGDVITDNQNNIYVTCNTRSLNFPVSASAYQPVNAGGKDGCVFKLSNDMTSLVWSTYIGGSGEDVSYSIQVDSTFNVYISGGTSSANFPVTAGVYQGINRGNIDGFISHISNNGQTLLHSTFVGTTQYDQLYFVQLDQNQNVYVLGQTRGAYPVTPGTFNNPNSGQFVHGFGPNLNVTLFSTVIGTGGFQPNISPTAFLVNECGNIFLSGWGGSNNLATDGYIGGNTNGMPVTFDAYRSVSDGSDFYIMVLSGGAQNLLYATYFGMNDPNAPDHVDGGTSRFDRKGIIYEAVCGGCGNNDNFPTTPGAWSNTNNGFNCNNAAFKFDLKNLNALASYTREDSCRQVTLSFVNSSVGGRNYFWDFGDGQISLVENPPPHDYNDPGTYTITLIITDLTTCTGRDTATLQVVIDPIPPILFDFTNTVICEGFTAQLGATNDPTYTYLWSPASSLSSTTIANPVASPTETTTYNVVVSDTNQCVVSNEILVTVSPPPTFDKGPNALVCPFGLSELLATGDGTFLWESSPYLSCTACANPKITAPEVLDDYFSVEITDIHGCKSIDSVKITTRPLPKITTYFSWEGRCEEEIFSFNAEIQYDDLTCPIDADYSWNFGDGVVSSDGKNIHVFNEPGVYEVSVQYGYSEVYTDEVIVLSKDSCLKNVFVPNTFTPNGDDSNDKVYVRTINAKEIRFRIYNRWGEEVFRTESLTEGWDGTYKGVKQTPQVFVYVAEVTFWDDTKKRMEGNITLVE